MIIRRILATFFVFMFTIVAIPTFLVYGLTRTYFSGSFYEGKVGDGVYDYLIDQTSNRIYSNDTTIQKYFQEADIKKEVRNVFTPELFSENSSNFGKQIENLKEKPREPIVIPLKIFRESLLTVTHNLAYHLFQNLPVCKEKQLPEVNQESIPTCVPKGYDYGSLSAPLSKQFEKTVYTFVPEQVQIDLMSTTSKDSNTAFYYIFSLIDKSKIYLLGILLFFMGMIALILNYPIALMVQYEAMAFLTSGFLGFLISILLQPLVSLLTDNYYQQISNNQSGLDGSPSGINEKTQHLIDYLVSFPSAEIQKISFIFLAIGVFLIITYFILRKGKNFELKSK